MRTSISELNKTLQVSPLWDLAGQLVDFEVPMLTRPLDVLPLPHVLLFELPGRGQLQRLSFPFGIYSPLIV